MIFRKTKRCVVCDQCGAEGPPSLAQAGAPLGDCAQSAARAAVDAGWHFDVLDRDISQEDGDGEGMFVLTVTQDPQMYCPTCKAARDQVAQQSPLIREFDAARRRGDKQAMNNILEGVRNAMNKDPRLRTEPLTEN